MSNTIKPGETKQIMREYIKSKIGKSKDNPKRVAQEVIKQIKRKELINVSKAMEAVGYSRNTIKANVGKLTKKPKYRVTVDNFLDSLKEKRSQSLNTITQKKLDKSTARDLAYTTDILQKNVNLIEGKPTSIDAGMGALLIRIEKQAKDQKDKDK